jgi:3-(3-hydroxy-phenyl)propionate hydroxylase
MCALALGKQGVPVIVCEAEPALTVDLRAGSFHPPTLELMAPYGITARMLELGIRVRRWQIRDRHSELIAEFDLGLLANDTSYPHRLHLEQHRLTPIQLDILRKETDVQVRFGSRIAGFEHRTDRVRVRLEGSNGIETLDAAYLVGADGGRSVVRKTLGAEFEGFTWPEKFLVASTTYDFAPHGFAMNVYVSDPTEWVALFKMPDLAPPGLWRVCFPIPPESDELMLEAANVERLMQGFVPSARPYDIRITSTYYVHQRVARSFRAGRVLLAGDAAHLNNPMGAFGLNGGIHDALNLADKLGRVWKGEADEDLLDLYARQRRTTALEQANKMSIRNLRLLEERDPEVRRQRLQDLMGIARDAKRAREYLLETSMITGFRQSMEIQ